MVGVITPERTTLDKPNAITMIGVSELRKLIENMTNSMDTAYLGIKGVDVTREAYENQGVPLGAYVGEIEKGSPALQAGIQRGDVIKKVGDVTIINFTTYTSAMRMHAPGDTVNVTVARPVQGIYKEIVIEITLGTAK